jgi:Fe-S oxidoreductase
MEVVAFAAILLLSLTIFLRRMARVAATILRSKPDPGRAFTKPGVRAWEFVRDVLFQWKVIRNRPLAGVAHAFVFWGFCAFSLVTVDHLLRGVGVFWLDGRAGVIGPVWFRVAFLFSNLVAVSIAGLAARRFLLRPRWLGEKVSLESGVIAGLIFALMITYMAEYLGYGGKLNWWLHTAALLVFLPLLPNTKHLHLILSPFSVLLKHEGFAEVAPLASDDDFGLDTGKDITRISALQAYSCVECGRCMEQCPAHLTGKSLNPKQIALGFREYLKQNEAQSEEPLIGVHLAEEAVFQCTTCGACEAACPVGVQHLPLIIGLRRGAVNTGKWEDERGGELFLRLERNGNPLGMSSLERDKFIQKNALPVYDGSQEYLLWLGCMGSYDPQGRETVLALVEVMKHVGVTFGVLKKEKCSGDSARRLGNDLAFQQLAEFNLSQMKAAGVKKIVSICPHCVRTIGVDWREFGASYEVEHHSELIARHMKKLPAGRGTAQVVYHDPCYLGRYKGTYREPRAVAAIAGRVGEASRHGERSFCCGAGGGLVFLGEEKGKRVSHERAEELVAAGAEVIAAACPFCHTMFRDALPAVAPGREPRLADIAQLAAERVRVPLH